MNAITITAASLHAALAEVEAIGRVQGTVAYAGGLAALRALLQPGEAAPASAMDIEWMRERLRHHAVPRDAGADIGGTFHAPTLAQEEAQPAHADSLPGAAPPTNIPPLPAGLGGADPYAPGAPAAEAAAQPLAPAPAPPPVLAAEGISSLPEADAAPAQRVQRHKYPGGRPLAVWTPARDELLRTEFPTCTDTAALFDRLNATGDEPHIASKEAMGQRAIKLGLRRKPEILRAVMRRAAQKGLEHANAARIGTLAGNEPPMPGTIASAAQCAELRRLWPTDATVSQVMDALSAMDGPTITAKTTIYRMAHTLGLPVPRPEATVEAAAEDPAPEPAPPAEPKPIAPTPLAAPIQPGDEKADAFAYFDAGKSVRDVVQDFSLGLTTAVGWHAEWKRQRAIGEARMGAMV